MQSTICSHSQVVVVEQLLLDFTTQFTLSLEQVGNAVRRGEWLPGEPIAAALTLRDALSQFIARRTDKLPVIDDQQQPLGVLHFGDLLQLREDLTCAR